MPLSTLLVFPKEGDTAAQNAFSWDHAMAHRSLMAVMGPLTQWSAMPYFIDPTQFDATAANKWNQYHQQAHDDFTSFLPAYYNAPPPPNPPLGIKSHQLLMDTDFSDPSQRQDHPWWTFANMMEHMMAANATQPLPTGANIPWWAQPPRRVLTYW